MADRPARRAFQIYLYTACLITVILLLFSGASAVYGIVRIAAPDTTSRGSGVFSFSSSSSSLASNSQRDAERDRGVAQLIQSGILALVAGGIFVFHWRRANQLESESDEPETAVQTAPVRRTAPRRRTPPRTPPADDITFEDE